MKIYALYLETELSALTFNNLLSYVSNEKQEKVKRFMKKADAERSLLSDLLSRIAIMENLKVQNRDIQFIYNKYGKPSLINFPDFHFNLSHSGNWIVCAIDNKAIGIDIEKIDNIDLDIAKRFFSDKEYFDLMNKPYSHRNSYFFDLWTLKESYIKALGCGLSLPLDSFAFTIEKDTISLDTANEFNQCFFKQYDIDKNYKMGICSLNNTFPNSIDFKTWEDVLSTLSIYK